MLGREKQPDEAVTIAPTDALMVAVLVSHPPGSGKSNSTSWNLGNNIHSNKGIDQENVSSLSFWILCDIQVFSQTLERN